MNKIKLLFSLLIFFPLDARRPAPSYTIMLDPAGDAKQTGRIIDDSLERAITIQFAYALKEALESLLPNSAVIITRSPGEVVYPLQNANFANRLPLDLYLNINFFSEPEQKQTLYIYQFSLGDTFVTRSYDLAMIPFDKAHQNNGIKSSEYAQKLHDLITDTQNRIPFIHGPFKLPFMPLIGIQAPALGIEMNLIKKDDWHSYIKPLATSIATIVE